MKTIRKGQINLEFLASAFVFLLAIGTLLTIGSDALPNFADSIETSTLHMEAYTVSTRVLSSTGSTAGGDTNWETSDSKIENIENFGLSTSDEEFLVLDESKIENITSFEYTTTGSYVNYSEFKSMTGVEHQYYFNFTWMPGMYSSNKTSAVEDPPLEEDITLWYELENESGPVVDSSDNNHDGVNNGAQRGVDGVFQSQAFSFDGNDDYVNAGTDPNVEDGVSVSLWVKPGVVESQKDAGVSAAVINSGRTSDGEAWELNLVDDDDWTGDSSGDLEWESRNSTNNDVAAVDGDFFENDQWYHIVGIANETTRKIYINGEEETDFVSLEGVGIPDEYDEVYIGAENRAGTDDDHFEGKIDEVRIYNRTLNEEEISALNTIESKIVRPDSGLALPGNDYILGTKRLEKKNNFYLITDSNEAYISDDWNFSGRTVLQEGDRTDINGTEFMVRSIEKNGRGGLMGLQRHIKGFGPNRDSDSTVIKFERFGSMKEEPIRIEVFAW